MAQVDDSALSSACGLPPETTWQRAKLPLERGSGLWSGVRGVFALLDRDGEVAYVRSSEDVRRRLVSRRGPGHNTRLVEARVLPMEDPDEAAAAAQSARLTLRPWLNERNRRLRAVPAFGRNLWMRRNIGSWVENTTDFDDSDEVLRR